MASNGSDISIHNKLSELDMFRLLVAKVRELDPDILTGWELHNESWGYVIERNTILGGNLFKRRALH